MDGRRWIQTTILTLSFFSWPYCSVLFLRPHLALLLLLSQGYSTGGPLRTALWNDASVGNPATCCRSLRLTKSCLAKRWDWLKTLYLTWVSAYIISQHPPFPFNHLTGFDYLHRWVLCWEIWLTARSKVNMQQFSKEIDYYRLDRKRDKNKLI